jgi:signal transduction histidine kinase/HAMP domain-containing protein
VQRFRLPIRWWLAGVFVVIAALTAALVAAVSSRQAESHLRENSENIAVGASVSAAFAVEQALEDGRLEEELAAIGGTNGLALFVFTGDRVMIGESNLRGIPWLAVPNRAEVLESTLAARRRYVASIGGGRVVIGLPLRRSSGAAALVAYSPRPRDYGEPAAIFRSEVVRAAIWAVLVSGLTGLLAASLISRRLRRIASAAAAIESGDFARELEPTYGDEIGELSLTIDRMRRRLGTAFGRLSAERDQLGLLLEQLHDGVVAVDRDLRVRFANANARRLLLGMPLEPGTALPDEAAGLPLGRVAAGLFAEGATVAEEHAEREDGAVLSLVGVPAAAASDLAVLVVADITQQERRRRAEREFVTNASHELRTPVTAIASAVEALRAGAADAPESRKRFVDLIGRQATRLTRLTSAMLVLARAETQQEALQLEPVELRGLLDEVAASSEPTNGVAVRVECERPVVAIGQRDIVEQVVANLVGNALRHTHDGEIVLRAWRADSEAVVEVADTGPGIPAAARERVFDRFYSHDEGRREGFGLGLAIARASAEAIGGRLAVESEPGRGTTARLVLRAKEERA